jgi:predicted Zn-dependent peptidase
MADCLKSYPPKGGILVTGSLPVESFAIPRENVIMKQYKLDNGLTVITVEKAEAETSAVLLVVAAGSRHETSETEGTAHFLEHMVFKGSKKRGNTKLISEFLDEIGGDYNAFTGKEYTGFHAHVAKEHTEKAFDFIADLAGQPLLREEDFNLERGVIFEEINLYDDTPMYHVEELFSQALFADDPLAHKISGTKETIGGLKVDALKSFFNNYYHAGNMVLVIVSDAEILSNLEAKISDYFQFDNNKRLIPTPSKARKSGPRLEVIKKDINQGNLVIGFEGPAFASRDRLKMNILMLLLGGMMSSRLFLRIREKLGLCYYIRANAEAYKTTGQVTTQAGIDPENLIKTTEAILHEISLLKTELIPESELTKTKEYFKGKLALAMEDSEELASFYAHQWVLGDKIETPEELVKQIDEITSLELRDIANKYLTPETLSMAVIAPSYDEEKLDKILESYK